MSDALPFPRTPTGIDYGTAFYTLEETGRGVRGRIKAMREGRNGQKYERTIAMIWEFDFDEDLQRVCEAMVRGLHSARNLGSV